MKHLLCEIGKLKKNKPIHKLPYQALPGPSQAQLQLSCFTFDSNSSDSCRCRSSSSFCLFRRPLEVGHGWTMESKMTVEHTSHFFDVPTLKIGKFDVQARGKVCLFEVNCQWPRKTDTDNLCDTFSGGCPKASTVQTPKFLYTNPTQRLNL